MRYCKECYSQGKKVKFKKTLPFSERALIVRLREECIDKNEVGSRVWDKVWDKVRNKVWGEVKEEVLDKRKELL